MREFRGAYRNERYAGLYEPMRRAMAAMGKAMWWFAALKEQTWYQGYEISFIHFLPFLLLCWCGGFAASDKPCIGRCNIPILRRRSAFPLEALFQRLRSWAEWAVLADETAFRCAAHFSAGCSMTQYGQAQNASCILRTSAQAPSRPIRCPPIPQIEADALCHCPHA